MTEPEKGSDRETSKPSVLIVDDSVELRKTLAEVIESEFGLHVVGQASNGREALLKARKSRPDLVFMDIRMLDMNGIEATAHLKREMPHTTVFILTTYDIPEYRAAATTAGADGYVLKKDIVNELAQIADRLAAARTAMLPV